MLGGNAVRQETSGIIVFRHVPKRTLHLFPPPPPAGILTGFSVADSIINPEAPLALRLSGQLLLGVVRIYNRKVQYLYEDCNHAIIKVQLVRALDMKLIRA